MTADAHETGAQLLDTMDGADDLTAWEVRCRDILRALLAEHAALKERLETLEAERVKIEGERDQARDDGLLQADIIGDMLCKALPAGHRGNNYEHAEQAVALIGSLKERLAAAEQERNRLKCIDLPETLRGLEQVEVERDALAASVLRCREYEQALRGEQAALADALHALADAEESWRFDDHQQPRSSWHDREDWRARNREALARAREARP